MGTISLVGNSLVIGSQTDQEVMVRVTLQGDVIEMEKLVPKSGQMQRVYELTELQEFIKSNIVVYFFDAFIRVFQLNWKNRSNASVTIAVSWSAQH